ncbi:MAG: hypothetical protein JJE30_13875 [Desulfuromonadales bacterium]|nr:hypothetical protein [Desulfuromonadales bacterium]
MPGSICKVFLSGGRYINTMQKIASSRNANLLIFQLDLPAAYCRGVVSQLSSGYTKAPLPEEEAGLFILRNPKVKHALSAARQSFDFMYIAALFRKISVAIKHIYIIVEKSVRS